MQQQNESLAKIVHTFIKVNRMHRACCDKLMTQVNMHRNQHRILMHLACPNARLSQKELAQKLEISTAAVAVMIKKLEKEGYISKKHSDYDNRFNEITITEKGVAAVKQTRSYFSDLDHVMFSGITENELKTLEKCLLKMDENLACKLGGKG